MWLPLVRMLLHFVLLLLLLMLRLVVLAALLLFPLLFSWYDVAVANAPHCLNSRFITGRGLVEVLIRRLVVKWQWVHWRPGGGPYTAANPSAY